MRVPAFDDLHVFISQILPKRWWCPEKAIHCLLPILCQCRTISPHGVKDDFCNQRCSSWNQVAQCYSWKRLLSYEVENIVVLMNMYHIISLLSANRSVVKPLYKYNAHRYSCHLLQIFPFNPCFQKQNNIRRTRWNKERKTDWAKGYPIGEMVIKAMGRAASQV